MLRIIILYADRVMRFSVIFFIPIIFNRSIPWLFNNNNDIRWVIIEQSPGERNIIFGIRPDMIYRFYGNIKRYCIIYI